MAVETSTLYHRASFVQVGSDGVVFKNVASATMTLYSYDKATDTITADATVSLNTGAVDVGSLTDVTALQLV